jgi:UDP-N-acetylmuramyl pentapeptide synthase
LNADDERVVNNYVNYVNNRQKDFYSYKGNNLCSYKIQNVNFPADGSGINFDLRRGEKPEISITAKLLGEYVIGCVVASAVVANLLGVEDAELRRGIAQLEPIKHRLEAIKGNAGVLVIDDSYNGNPEGVAEAIKVLSRFSARRKIFLTPGLVETGNKDEQIHLEIGKQLAKTADLVILIKNSVSDYIARGLADSGLNSLISSSILNNSFSVPGFQPKKAIKLIMASGKYPFLR